MVQSPSHRYVAAVADNWQMAIWDMESQRLLHVFETPQGVYAANAAFAFNDDEKQIAFSAGTEAKVWDLASGQELKSVNLPPGFMDRMAPDGQGRLLLVRQESLDSHSQPFGPNPDPQKTPRVCRVRDLLGDEPSKALVEFRDFPANTIQIQMAPNAKWVAVEGLVYDGQTRKRAIRLFETLSGKERWTLSANFTLKTYLTDRFDALGKYVMIGTDSREDNDLIEAESGRRNRQFDRSIPRVQAR